MTLTIAQSAHRADRRQWRWAVWLQGRPEELDEVADVTYTLHPSFPEPAQLIKDRASGFRLEADGWGEFQLQVRIRHKDGGELELRHWLELAQDTDCAKPRRTGGAVAKRIFLSFTATDASLGDVIARALVERRMQVIRSEDFVAGVPWREAIEQAARRTDALILMFTNRLSPWMEQELAHFRDAGKAVLAVIVFDSSPPKMIPPPLRKLKRLLVKWDAWAGTRDALAGDVARRIIDKLSVDAQNDDP